MNSNQLPPIPQTTPEEDDKLRRKLQQELDFSRSLTAEPSDSTSTNGQSPSADSQNPQQSTNTPATPAAKPPSTQGAQRLPSDTPGQLGLKEVGAAVAGGAIDAVQGIGSNLNQAVQTIGGKEIKPGEDYTPSWLKLPNGMEPENKTWWGKALRGMVQIGVLSAGVGRAGKGIAGKIGMSPAETFLGKATRTAVTGGIANNLSTFSTDDNLTRTISDAIPWFPKVLATNDSDSPMMRRLKNTVEGAGLDGAFEGIAGLLHGKRLMVNAETRAANPTLREEAIASRQEGSTLAKLQADQRAARKQLDVSKVALTAAKGTDVEAQATEAFTTAQDAHKAARKLYQDTKKATGPAEVGAQAAADKVDELAKVRTDNERAAAQHAFEKDPEFLNGPNVRASNPDLFDPAERGLITAPMDVKEATTGALRAATKVINDPAQALGRLGNVVTEPKLKMMLEDGNPAVRKVLNDMIDSIQNSDRDFAVNINGMKYSRQETVNAVVAQSLKHLDVIANPEDLEGLRKSLLSDNNVVNLKGAPVEYMNRVNTAATQLLIRVTSEEIADIASVARSYEASGVIDTTHLGNLLSDRLELLLKEHKKSAYVRGSELESMRHNWASAFIPKPDDYKATMAGIDMDVNKVMATVRGAQEAGDPRLLNHFITAASISDGSVRTLDDLATYMSKKIGMKGWMSGSPEEQGYILQGLTSTFYNSVLSSPKTTIRAWAGTGLATLLRPTTMLLGGTLRGDGRIMAKSLAQFHALGEGFGEAVGMFNKARQNWMSDGSIMNPSAVSVKVPYHKTPEFQALKEWADLQGTTGDKSGVVWAENLSKFNAHALVNHTVGMMDSGDSFFRTLIGRMELKGQAFDEAWHTHSGKVDGTMVRTYEEKFRNLVFDEDGIVTDTAARMAGDEVSLTTPLDGMFASLTQAVQSVPALRPFLMFPKTAVNAATLLATHTPILNGFVKEVDDIMNVTAENAPAMMAKYGITDLAAAQAGYEGRIALGNIIVGSAAALYLNGNLTGNGPGDRAKRDMWQAQGWVPRSVKIPGIDKWISYDSLEPFHTFLAIVGDIGDNLDEMGESVASDGLARLGYFVAQNATNKTFLNGLSPLMDIVSGGFQKGSASTAIAQTLNNAVPFAGFRNYISSSFGAGLREVNDNVWEKIQNRNPILRQQLPAMRDPINGSIIKNQDPITNLFNATSPFQLSPDWDPVRQMLITSGYDLKTSLTTGLMGEQLSKQDQNGIRQEMANEGIQESLRTMMANPRFQESLDKLKRERDRGVTSAQSGVPENWHLIEIKRIFDTAKKNAMSRFYAKTGETQAVREAQLKKQAGNAASQGEVGLSEGFLQNINKIPK